MTSILDLFPIVTVLMVGLGVEKALNRIRPHSFRKTELYSIVLLLGTFVLIFPLFIIGVQPEGVLKIRIFSITVSVIDFQAYSVLYFIVGLILSIVFGYQALRELFTNMSDFTLDLKQLKDYRIALCTILIIEYLILQIILPLRGFDALYYYFPEAEIFYQSKRITEFNYLSFLPVVKSPLNVLLYVYTYFIAGELAITLIPFLFLLGMVFLAYDFSLEVFEDKNIARLSAVLLLVLPLTYWTMNYWAFYQEIYLGFFFTLAGYLSFKLYKSPSRTELTIYVLIGIILTMFSKISGWMLPVILVLWLPTGKQGKYIRVIFVIALMLFLSVQTATRVWIGNSIAIILILGLVIYLIKNEKGEPNKPIHTISNVVLGIFFGSTWLLNRITLSKLALEEINKQFFEISKNIIFFYPMEIEDPLSYTLETVHRVNYFSAILIIFLGTAFVLPWIIPKIAVIKLHRNYSFIFIWILVVFSIWSCYYINNSIRYLIPLIIPFIMLISLGTIRLTSYFTDNRIKTLIEVVMIFLGCLSFYYLIPIKSLIISNEIQKQVGLAYNQAALNYYSHPISLMILLGVIIAIFCGILKIKIRLRNLNTKNPFVLSLMTIMFLIVTIPLTVQGFLLVSVQCNLSEFHSIIEYEYRDSYQEIVNVIQQQNQPLVAIMTVRTPGLQFFTKQPVIDIYYQNDFFVDDPFFTSNNMTEIKENLNSPFLHSIFFSEFGERNLFPIKFLVVPSSSNLYYEDFLENIQSRSYFFSRLSLEPFIRLLFQNPDFKLYEIL